MSFEASAQNIYLENGNILRASVRDEEGNWRESEINLDDFIGNEDGWFMWDGVSKWFLLLFFFSSTSPSLPTSSRLHISLSFSYSWIHF